MAYIRFADRKEGQCAAPLWGNAERIGLVCGKPSQAGHSYCDECAAALTAGRPTLKEYLSKMDTPEARAWHMKKGLYSEYVEDRK